jgi:hypothetical protein
LSRLWDACPAGGNSSSSNGGGKLVVHNDAKPAPASPNSTG